jgi:hypothetical protein
MARIGERMNAYRTLVGKHAVETAGLRAGTFRIRSKSVNTSTATSGVMVITTKAREMLVAAMIDH